MIDFILSLIAPHECLSCQRLGALLCGACLADLIHDTEATCIGCGRSNDRGVCDECRPDWPVERAFVFSERSGVMKTLINEFKYGHKRSAYRQLAIVGASLLPYRPDGVIIPIPTNTRHIRERGYDHSRLVARHLARRSGINYKPLLLRRTNSVQHGASKRDRRQQAARAFAIKGALDPSQLYILYDDIVTTGSSLQSGITLLRDAGARRIWVLAIARQPLGA